jgi:hypothetical protein
MEKKDKRSTSYIPTKVENGEFKRSLLRRRALRVASHFPSSGEGCVMKSWRKSPAFLTRCLYTRQGLSEVGGHVSFVEVSPSAVSWIDNLPTGAQSKAGVEELARLALQA